MNLKQLIREEVLNIVHEVGEGTGKIYDWRLEKSINLRFGRWVYKYKFDSENIDYVVSIYTEPLDSPNDSKKAAITFYTDDSANFADYEKSTNLNELYNVMATLMDIVLDFIQIHDDVEEIYISPSKAFENDNRRANLYMAYIRKNISKLPGNWKIDNSHPDEIIINKID